MSLGAVHARPRRASGVRARALRADGHAALRERAEAADATATKHADLSAVWRGLTTGELRLVLSFHTPKRCGLVIAPQTSTRRSKLSARKLDILTRVLLGGRHKLAGVDLSISASTVSMVTRQAFEFMGLACPPSKVPLMLCILAQTTRENAPAFLGRESKLEHEGVNLRVVSVPRPDLLLKPRLSSGEFVVLSRLVEGLSHDAIARERRSSAHTIANQLTSAFRRVGVSGRLELVALLARSLDNTAEQSTISDAQADPTAESMPRPRLHE